MKKNDYVIASINNPDFTAEDFRNIAGYNLKDTLMLKEEDYLSNEFIKNNPLFLDSTGMFSKEKFSEFYKKKLEDFNNFSNEDFADSYQYSPFDTRRMGKSKVKPFGVTFFNNPNPTKQTIGIEGPNALGQRLLSDREIAQNEKVYDPESGKFLDYSPNDHAFFKNPLKWAKSIIEDPLVLAIYDENGTHIDPVTGRQMKHVKGQYKLNSNGLPYYEKLNGRSLIGRDILSITDTLTVDGSWINKYDFLDSDDLDKSIGDTILKTAAAVAPLFIPYVNAAYSKYVGYYGTYLMLRELSKTAPMLYSMGTALFTDKPDTYLTNTIAGYANKLTTSTSDYSKSHVFSFENFGNLISDVALQWEQQQAVIRGFNKLNNATNKRIQAAKIKSLAEYEDETNKLIQQVKLGNVSAARARELAGASNAKELKEIIANNQWELTNYGRIAQDRNLKAIEEYIQNRTRLGQDMSLVYMALISNTDVYDSAIQHGASKKEAAALALGSTAGMFSVDKFLGLGEMFFQEPAEREIFRSSIRSQAKDALKWLKAESKENPGQYFKIGVDAAKKAVRTFREKTADRSLPLFGKAIGEGLEEVSEELVTDMVKSAGELAADFGWISGPTDLGAWDNILERYGMSLLGGTIGGGIFGLKMLGVQNQNGPKTLELLVRQNKTAEVRRELKDLYEKGQLGSTNLAAEYEERDGKRVFLTADDKHISQNEYVYKIMSDAVNLLETIINGERLNKSEDDLFQQLVLKDDRYLKLKSFLQDKSYLTGYQERYQDLVEGIVKNKAEIAALGDAKTPEEKVKLTELLKSLQTKQLERDRFLSGELSLEYLRKLDFLMNPVLTRGFMSLTKDDFARYVTGASYESLDLGARMSVEKLYLHYLKSGQVKEDAKNAFDAFTDASAKLGNPIMNYVQTYDPSYKFWDSLIAVLEDAKLAAAWDWDEQLEGETEEEFENRDKRLEGEDDIEFLMRISHRQDMITKHNENIFNYLQNALSLGTRLDATTKRRLNIILDKTEHQIKKNLLRQLGITDPLIGREIMAGTNPEDVLPKMRTLKESEIRDSIWKNLNTKDFGFKTGSFIDEETGEKTEPVFIPAAFGTEGNLSEDQQVMLEVHKRMMERLNLDTFDILSLYNALGKTPKEVKTEFYNLYNQLLEEVVTEDEKSAEWKYPNFTGSFIREVTNHPIADLLIKYGKGLEAITAEDPEERKKAISELANSISLQDIRETAVEALVAKELEEWENSGIQEQADKITAALKDNPTLKLLKQLQGTETINSPAEDILDMVAKQFGQENLTKMLKDLGIRWDEQREEGEFELTKVEQEKLEKAKEVIEIAKSIIAAMYKESYLGDSMPYNKAINEFVHAHKETQENWEDLPIIDKQVGQSLYHSLDLYSQELDEWIALGNRSSDNKVKSVTETKAAYEGVKHSLLVNTLGKDNWMLEGYSGDSDIHAEVMIYRNIKKAIESGEKTIEDIYDEFLSKLNADHIVSQITSEISPGLSTSIFTDYDKFMHLAVLSAISKDDYLKAERDFMKANPEVAYLATQEPALLYVYALKTNPQAIYAAIDKIAKLAATKGMQIPTFYGLICTGIGGAGKTDAVAKFANFLSKDEPTWISGPTSTLLEGLEKITPKGVVKGREDLINYILGGKKDLLEKYTLGKGVDGRMTLTLSNLNDLIVTANAPKHLIIDEGTHYSNLELQVISQWAKKAGVSVIVLGDENQKGNTIVKNNSRGSLHINNLAREILIGLRTPRLAVSLRTRNLWKTRNQGLLVRLMDALRNASDNESTEKAKQDFIKALNEDYFLEYWEDENDIHGDKIVKTSNEIDFTKLKDKKVAYIGSNFNEFQSKLGNDVLHFPNLEAVQGQEIDYVIADNIQSKFDYDNAFELLEGMQAFYTAISRSKIGGIIIDGEGAFSKIQNRSQNYTTQSINLSQDIITLLNELRSKEIEEELNNIPAEEEKEIKEEKKSKKPEEKKPKDAKKLLKEIEADGFPEEEFNGEYRAYGNIQFLGGVIREDITRNSAILGTYYVNKWLASGVRRDIGIFGSKGVLASNPEEKAQLVYNLTCLKNVFTFDKFQMDEKDNLYLPLEEFNKLPAQVRELFDNDPGNFRNVKYYAVAEDYDENTHSLIGNTTADKKAVSFIKDAKGTKKVITILAKIKDKNGEDLTITLGAVANPTTWENYVKNKIAPENEAERAAFEENRAAELEAIKLYKDDLNDLVLENKPVEIDRPRFTNQTELIPIDNAIPLGEFDGGISEWDKITKNFAVSPVHVIVENLKNINPQLSEDLLGKPVIFVSADLTLNPEKLRDIWKDQQLHRDSSNAVVRMIVLDNNGISFSSLYRDVFNEIYSTTIETEDNDTYDFSIPYETEPAAIRTFIAMWNFRANLIKFNAKVKEFAESKGWSLEDLQAKVKTYNDLYNKAKLELLGEKTGSLSDELFAKWLNDNATLNGVEDTLTIREFNQNTLSEYREFRLGYSPEGAYIGRLYGVKSELYAEKEPNGVYITPILAKLYEGVINNYFEALVNPIFKDSIKDLPEGAENQNIDIVEEKWFDTVQSDRTLKLGIDSNKVVTIRVPNEDDLNSFSYAFIKIPRNLRWKALRGKDKFLRIYNKDVPANEPKPYRVKLKVNSEEVTCDYLNIDEAFEFDGKKGILKSSDKPREGLTGEIKVVWDPGEGLKYDRYVDTRMDSFLSIMIHGIVAQKEYNKFDKKKAFFASDAAFPYGIYGDAVLKPKRKGESNYAAESLSHKALFTTNMVPGQPLISFKLKRTVTENKDVKIDEAITLSEEDKELTTIINDINSISGTTIIESLNDVPDVKNRKAYIQEAINTHNNKLLNSPNLFDPSKIILNLGQETLLKHYPILSEITEVTKKPGEPIMVKVNDTKFKVISDRGNISLVEYFTEVTERKVIVENGGTAYTLLSMKDYVIKRIETVNKDILGEVQAILDEIIAPDNQNTPINKATYNKAPIFKSIDNVADKHYSDEDVVDLIKESIEKFLECNG